jgi:hypothetical protein
MIEERKREIMSKSPIVKGKNIFLQYITQKDIVEGVFLVRNSEIRIRKTGKTGKENLSWGPRNRILIVKTTFYIFKLYVA